MSGAVIIQDGATRSIATVSVQGLQGPPGPAVVPGMPGQLYVTNAAATAGVWDSTILIVPGSLTAALLTGASIKQTQGGTLGSPTVEHPLVVQPRDPAKAPFQVLLAGGLFNSTWDDTLSVGYNCDRQNTDAAIYWTLEQDYEVAPGTHWFEYYIEYFGTNRAHTYRPFYLNINKSTDVGSLVFALPGMSSAGTMTWTNGDGTQTYLQLANAGFFLRNNFQFFGYDSTAVNRNIAYVTSGDYMIVGDFALPNSLLVRGGAGNGGVAGIVLESGPTNQIDLWDTTAAQAIKFSLSAAGSNSIVSAATAASLSIGTNKSGATTVIKADANATIATAASLGLTLENNLQLFGKDTGAVARNIAYITNGNYALIGDFALPNSLIIRGGAGGSGLAGIVLEVGPTNKFDIYDANNVAAISVVTNASGSTTILGGTGVTSLAIGPNKSGASLHLQSGAATDAMVFSNPGGGALVVATRLGQSVAHQVTKGTNYTIDSSGAGDEQIWMTTACTITLPDPAVSAGRVMEIVVGYDPAVGGGTIARHGAENINGVASNITLVTGDKFSVLQVRCNGTDWVIKGGLSI